MSVRTAARFDVHKLLSDDDWRMGQTAMRFLGAPELLVDQDGWRKCRIPVCFPSQRSTLRIMTDAQGVCLAGGCTLHLRVSAKEAIH